MKQLFPYLMLLLVGSGFPVGAPMGQVSSPWSKVKSSVPFSAVDAPDTAWEPINPAGITLQSRINVPPGYERLPAAETSMEAYLRQLPLKKDGVPVYLHNGHRKNRQDVHVAVLDLAVGTQDLQQCADAVMRLRAEYLFQAKKYSLIHFNFTNGFRAEYLSYAQGYRAQVKRNTVNWVKQAPEDYSYGTFRQYLNLVFAYAGTASLKKEMKPVPALEQVLPGDVFIQGGFPGHAMMVMDVAVHARTGKRIFLLSQSYMPAQQIHITKNQYHSEISPWYSTQTDGHIYTPEWTFKTSDLRRFTAW